MFLPWRDIAIAICDTAIMLLTLAIIVVILIPVVDGSDEARCRLSFTNVLEYEALADVCKDVRARQAIIMWEEINRVAKTD